MIRDFLLSRAAADDMRESAEVESHMKLSRWLTVSSQLEDLSRQVLEDGSEVD